MSIASDDLFDHARKLQHNYPNYVVAVYILEEAPQLYSQLKYLYFKSINEVINFIETQQNSTTSPPFFDESHLSLTIEERIPGQLDERVHNYIFFDPVKYRTIKSGEYQIVTPPASPRGTVVVTPPGSPLASPRGSVVVTPVGSVVTPRGTIPVVATTAVAAQTAKPNFIDSIVRTIFPSKAGAITPPPSLAQSTGYRGSPSLSRRNLTFDDY